MGLWWALERMLARALVVQALVVQKLRRGILYPEAVVYFASLADLVVAV